jgi:1-acyl-sn-glycerol-3-phosphate acyltransferase
MRLILIIANPYKLHIVRKAEVPKGKPVIYASTHGFKDDILNAIVLTNKSSYILLAALDEFYKTIDGILAWLIGVILVDGTDKRSRAASLVKMELAMKYGTNILMFPEGAWNLTDSLLVQKLYSGIYNLATQSNALVVPIATHIEGKDCYAILDETFDISAHEMDDGIRILRDKLATAKYELIERYSNCSRNDLEADGISLRNAWEESKLKFISEAKDSRTKDLGIFSIYRYKDKNITEYAEAFAHLCNIEITRHNAFLLHPNRLEYPHYDR